MASLRVNVDSILDMRVPEPKAAPAELAEDAVLTVLFQTTTAPSPLTRERAKTHRSSHISESEGAPAMKRERLDMEAARRASLLDNEAREMGS